MTREHIDVMNLLSGKKQTVSTSEILTSKIDPPTWQPRKKFEEEKLQQLQESINNHGLLQPIIVEPVGDRYRVVAGERRFRAIQNLGWQNVPVKIIENLDDIKRIQIQIAENLNREDITPLERSKAVLKLFDVSLGWDLDKTINNLRNYHQKHLAPELTPTVGVILEQLGKSENTVIGWLKLLKLPQELQDMLDDPNGVFTPKHAGEILKLSDIKEQIEVARLIEIDHLSAEQTKEVVEKRAKPVFKSFSLYAKKLISTVQNEDLRTITKETKGQYVCEIETLLKELTDVLSRMTKMV